MILAAEICKPTTVPCVMLTAALVTGSKTIIPHPSRNYSLSGVTSIAYKRLRSVKYIIPLQMVGVL